MDRELKPSPDAAPAAASSVRVWDLPTRLFHWLLVVLIVLQFGTGKFGWLDMRWHFWFGYATLALIVFRFVWGIVGSQTSRFVSFVRGPMTVLRYLRAQFGAVKPSMTVGHNPLGGWSSVLLLTSVLVQTITGLFASDAIDTDGPFVARVTAATVKWMTYLHDLNENVLLLLIALHVVAVLLYLLIKHDNLIVPMLTGRKIGISGTPPRFVNPWRALPLLLISGALVIALIWWFGD